MAQAGNGRGLAADSGGQDERSSSSAPQPPPSPRKTTKGRLLISRQSMETAFAAVCKAHVPRPGQPMSRTREEVTALVQVSLFFLLEVFVVGRLSRVGWSLGKREQCVGACFFLPVNVAGVRGPEDAGCFHADFLCDTRCDTLSLHHCAAELSAELRGGTTSCVTRTEQIFVAIHTHAPARP